ncbi:hypothetical protein [Streptomyces collinus]|uniref:Peptidoglycan binding domain-containing protein n=1 Tax=Streptomyces collinus (strain DSM 40733 / Tue 365) TaxID=1214242 RepID=S5V0W1_STRC3|nr:hypothetical protein [Streptomyces collinus]AGS71631.1 hypothetical protein B446_24100 [Streptomyces collinus Tu 365]UJA10276.1 hypothetical protein HGI10_42380 [Streptomyces collinus]UJA14860.1 hypothetical protein HGI09_21740 [Streptomyces collinus]
MSRETDTPSSGPNGTGGAAYPSGTPPYGTPLASDAAADAGRSAAQPEERKTETTLTTRIRINIPGSRPIPPVVVRKPVAESEAAVDAPAAEPPRPSAPAAAPPAAPEPAAEPAAQAEEKTSDWFAPRKSGTPKGGQGGGGTNGAGTPGGSAAASAPSGPSPASGPSAASAPGARPGAPGASGTSGGPGAKSGAGRPGGVVGSMGAPGGPRPGGPKGSGLPSATGGPVAPGHGGGTGSFDVTEALAAGPLGGSRPGTPGGGEAGRDDLPYFSESGQNGFAGTSGANGANGTGGSGGPNGFNGPTGQGGRGPQGPAGPTGGPVTGDGPFVPPAAPRSALSDLDLGPGESFTGPGGYGDTGSHQLPGDTGSHQLPGDTGSHRMPGGYGDTGSRQMPGGYGDTGSHQLPGDTGSHRMPGGGLSDDTAILTPQKPAPEPGTPGYRAPDNVSGHTVTSGIPVVPGAGNAPFGPGGALADGPAPRTAPKRPEPAAPPKAAAKPKKKGRSKLVLLAVGVVVLAGGAYGAGLLMNHTDVPKGTTVLGVDIGGGTRDDAVKKLDDAFGKRVNQPLKLSVGGKTVSIAPDNAGLQFDFQSTVAAAAKSDYNPVTVVGSLFGQKREIEPVMPVDEEKLQAALQQTGGGSGSGTVTDGGVEFKAGKAVAVYGKAGKAVDAARSGQAVAQAYRTMVETGTAVPVTVPSTTRQPTVSNAEVDREMKDFAGPAMSANVTVRTDALHSIQMSPQKSLWKFLRVTAVDGKLVDKPDLAALKQLYGQTFDGVLITRANGKKTAVTPQDVYLALRGALTSRTNRVAVIATNPS